MVQVVDIIRGFYLGKFCHKTSGMRVQAALKNVLCHLSAVRHWINSRPATLSFSSRAPQTSLRAQSPWKRQQSFYFCKPKHSKRVSNVESNGCPEWCVRICSNKSCSMVVMTDKYSKSIPCAPFVRNQEPSQWAVWPTSWCCSCDPRNFALDLIPNIPVDQAGSTIYFQYGVIHWQLTMCI